jgi:hypothetical protein
VVVVAAAPTLLLLFPDNHQKTNGLWPSVPISVGNATFVINEHVYVLQFFSIESRHPSHLAEGAGWPYLQLDDAL